MLTLRSITITAIAIANTALAYAQPSDINYYEGKEQVAGQYVTYAINEYYPDSYKQSNRFYLNNVCNVMERSPIRYANGKYPESVRHIGCSFIHKKYNTMQMYKALIESFTAKQIAGMYAAERRSSTGIGLIIDPLGRVIEVTLSIPNEPAFTSIPPDIYLKFEQNLKRYVKYREDQCGAPGVYVYYYINISSWFPVSDAKYKRKLERYIREYLK